MNKMRLFFIITIIHLLIVAFLYSNTNRISYSYADNEQNPLIINSMCDSSAFNGIDTLFSIPFNHPCFGITRTGNDLWTCVAGSGIYKISFDGEVKKYFLRTKYSESLFFGGGLTWDGNYLWLCEESTHKIFKIDTLDGTPVGNLKLPNFGPNSPNFGIAWDGNYIWGSIYGDSSRCYKINPNNFNIVDSLLTPDIFIIAYGNSYLHGIVPVSSYYPDWVWETTFYKIDINSKVIIDSVKCNFPYSTGLDVDHNDLWMVSGSKEFGGTERIYCIKNPLYNHDNGTHNPSNIILHYNYPNPFNSTTTITYSVFNLDFITLKIYNVIGEEIQTLVSEYQKPITYEVKFNAGQLPTGIYFYKLESGNNFTEVKKMLLIR